MSTVVHHTTPAVPEDAAYNQKAATPPRAGRPRIKPEAEVVADGLKLLRAMPRTYAWKVHGGAFGNVGEPDFDGCSNGRSLKFEAKRPGKEPTPAQLGALRRWGKSGALVGWFTSNEHILQLLDHIDDPVFVPDLSHPGCSCARHGGQDG